MAKSRAGSRSRARDAASPGEVRRLPQQERARQTFERVLAAATSLLEEEGLPALNTNAVADRAGLTVPALYRYFTNKEAILVSLAERYLAAERTWTAGLGALEDPAVPLDRAVAALVQGYAAAADAHPAIVPLRTAMRAVPELAHLEESSIAETSSRLEGALRERLSRLRPAARKTVCRLVIETVCSAIDRGRGSEEAERRRRLAELSAMVSAYLERLAEGPDG